MRAVFTRKKPLLYPRAGGFVLIDLLIGLSIILIVGGAALLCMMQLNRQAQVNRLYSCASTALHNQLQAALNDAPYLPQGIVSGTGTGPAEVPDSLNSTTQAVSLSGSPPVTGTISTSVTEPVSTGVSGLYVAQITGTCSFNYRGKIYTVVGNTLRSSDL